MNCTGKVDLLTIMTSQADETDTSTIVKQKSRLR